MYGDVKSDRRWSEIWGKTLVTATDGNRWQHVSKSPYRSSLLPALHCSPIKILIEFRASVQRNGWLCSVINCKNEIQNYLFEIQFNQNVLNSSKKPLLGLPSEHRPTLPTEWTQPLNWIKAKTNWTKNKIWLNESTNCRQFLLKQTINTKKLNQINQNKPFVCLIWVIKESKCKTCSQ